eukprot:GSA120T00019197001.1
MYSCRDPCAVNSLEIIITAFTEPIGTDQLLLLLSSILYVLAEADRFTRWKEDYFRYFYTDGMESMEGKNEKEFLG